MENKIGVVPELKECPFCGGAGSMRIRKTYADEYDKIHITWEVGCGSCDIRFLGYDKIRRDSKTGEIEIVEDGLANAVNYWNDRV